MHAIRIHTQTHNNAGITTLSATVVAMKEEVVGSGLKSCSDTFDKQMERVKRSKQSTKCNRNKATKNYCGPTI